LKSKEIPHLPVEWKKYFWDCSFEELNLQTYSKFITERILHLGTWPDISWLYRHINKEQFKNIATTSRRLDSRTKNFWQIYFSS